MDGGQAKILDGNVALVTGASRGLGAATAIALAGLGAHVVIAARGDAGLAATDDAIRSAGGEATLLPADLTRADVADAIGPSLYERFGRLDILVHAAVTSPAPAAAAMIGPGAWDPAFGINATATWRLIRATDFLLRAAGHGRAVVVVRAQTPAAYQGLASASMAAREALVRAWAAELNRTTLRVNLFEQAPVCDPATLVAMCLPSEMRNGATVASVHPIETP